MALVCPKCGRVYSKFVNSHYAKHISECDPTPTLCACGCGRVVKSKGCKYAQGHNRTGKKQTDAEKLKRSILMKDVHRNMSPDKKRDIAISISRTKNTEAGKKKSRAAYEMCKDRIRESALGRIPWNKMSDDDKITIICAQCGKSVVTVPSIAKTKKFCSSKCKIKYRTGRKMDNWNPNSAINNDTAGRGICGEYKGVRFRSSLELSFLVRAMEIGETVVAEPVCIKICDYISDSDAKLFEVPPARKYVPDYIIDGKCMVEIKPECGLMPENDNFLINVAKLLALKGYSQQNKLEHMWLTDEDMGELVLTYSQIRAIPKNDIIFFKEKHRKKFLQEASDIEDAWVN